MVIIDRFEGDYAVVEYDNIVFNLPKGLLPKDAKEGDLLKIEIRVDQEKTKTKKENINKQLENFFDE